jgi:serine protease AprX
MATRIRSLQVPLTVLAILLALSTPGTTARQISLRAFLAPDLAEVLRQAPNTPARVIVRGDVTTLVAAASRHGLTLHSTLDDFVVVSGTAAQVRALGAEPSVIALNNDRPVSVAMSVSDRAMAADQTRAGSPGLLGLIGIPGVTGRGVGVAVVDSGISNHEALKGKVVAAVSFVPDDPKVNDPFGHGTHLAGIIAGARTAARTVTDDYSGGIAPGAHLVNVRVIG